jgi:hypothetical protein
MKKISTVSIITLFVMAGCTGGNKQLSDDFITVDVTASYPEKELILQDFMDVEYIPLETTDEFVCQGLVQDIGKDFLLVTNQLHVNDGDIFIFDRKTGKALKKINRRGNGGEEYIRIFGMILDEDNGEMFVNDMPGKKILIYDLDGNFKRKFRHKEGANYFEVYSLDRENLICHDGSYSNEGVAYNRQAFMVISKQDGSIIKELEIPFKEKIITTLISKDEVKKLIFSVSPDHYPIIPYIDNWLLVEPSSDTVYSYLPDHTMAPFIARTPSVQSMDPAVFLLPGVLTDRYYFMETVKKVHRFPGAKLMYDKQEKSIFEYTVYNDDYSVKKPVYMKTQPVKGEIATWQSLEAGPLVEAYEKGQLKGKLEEIATTLDEESNPVIMLIKHKK